MKVSYYGIEQNVVEEGQFHLRMSSEEAGILRRALDKQVDDLPDGWELLIRLPIKDRPPRRTIRATT